jgi:branched-chain amino acid transport system ATP-binding protein
MVAIARVLMSRPRMIVVDEPTMGLSTLYVDRVLELFRTINQEGRVDLHGRAECEPRT